MFEHEKLDVYHLSIQFADWMYLKIKNLRGQTRFARDQLNQSAQAIVLNIAIGSSKRSFDERAHHFEIARGNAFECAAIIDILIIFKVLTTETAAPGKKLLRQIAGMLRILTEMKSAVNEESAHYRAEKTTPIKVNGDTETEGSAG